MEAREADDLLEEFFPDFGDRSRAREFAKLNPEQRALWLYATVDGINQRLLDGGERLDSMEACVKKIASRNKPKIAPHLMQALYTTGALAAGVWAVVTGFQPR